MFNQKRLDEIYEAMSRSSDRFVNGTGKYNKPPNLTDQIQSTLDKPNFQPGDLVCLKDIPSLVISYITGKGHIICNYKTSEGSSGVIICFADDLTLIKKG